MNTFIHGSRRYVVTSVAVQIRAGDWGLFLERGAILPTNVDQVQLRHLIDEDLVAELTEATA